jgi:hypothetical protein
MSEAASQTLAEVLAQSDRRAYAEQQLYIHSPFDTFWTSAVVFALLIGSYVLLASAAHHDWLAPGPRETLLPIATRTALILSLLIATALGVQRFSRTADRTEIAQYPAMLKKGALSAAHLAMLTPSDARLRLATGIGILMGLSISFLLLPRSPIWAAHGIFDPLFVWFAGSVTILTVLFARGVELTRATSIGWRRFIDEEVKIDLLRVDQLRVIGRSAARVALIWFSISAVTCLFFVSGELTLVSVVLLVGCAAMGVWIFVRTMEHMHKKIIAVKSLELERVRARIDELRQNMHEDAEAATKLQGALAYEARIIEAPEWPFDQSTLLRVGASALILTVPWFGQAIAGVAVEKIGAWIR